MHFLGWLQCTLVRTRRTYTYTCTYTCTMFSIAGSRSQPRESPYLGKIITSRSVCTTGTLRNAYGTRCWSSCSLLPNTGELAEEGKGVGSRQGKTRFRWYLALSAGTATNPLRAPPPCLRVNFQHNTSAGANQGGTTVPKRRHEQSIRAHYPLPLSIVLYVAYHWHSVTVAGIPS